MAVVQSVYGSSGASSNSGPTATLTAAPTAGHLLVAFVLTNFPGSSIGTPNAGWSPPTGTAGSGVSNSGSSIAVWVRTVQAGDGTTVAPGTLNSARRWDLVVVEVDGTTVTGVNAGGTASSVTSFATSVSSVSGDTVLACASLAAAGDSGFAASAGYTVLQSEGDANNPSMLFAAGTATGTTSSPTLSWTPADKGNWAVIAVTPSGGGGAFTGTATQTLPSLTQTAGGTVTAPGFHATAAQTFPVLTQAAAATTTAPGFTATAAQTLPAFGQAAAGTSSAPQFTGNADQTLPALTTAADATATAPQYPAVAAQTLPALTGTAAGGSTVPDFPATAASVLPAAGQTAAGAVTLPAGDAQAAQTLPPLGQQATGTTTVPAYTGSADQTLPPLAQTAAGTVAAPRFVAVTVTQLAALTQQATATALGPPFTATATSTLPALGQTVAGTTAEQSPILIDLTGVTARFAFTADQPRLAATAGTPRFAFTAAPPTLKEP